jgi:hypothetical protein|tara:strand:- start:291 stop:515 length:225 start_codon:yes stop_codon:yes gene_type:complete
MKKKNKSKQAKDQKRNKKRSIKTREKKKRFAKVKLKRQALAREEKKAEKETYFLEKEVRALQNRACQIRKIKEQ